MLRYQRRYDHNGRMYIADSVDANADIVDMFVSHLDQHLHAAGHLNILISKRITHQYIKYIK